MINLIIADDHALFRDGLTNFLSSKEGIHIQGIAHDGEQLLEMVDKLTPDIVILDHDMPGTSGMDALARIRHLHANIKVIVLTALADERLLFDYDEMGVDGILLKVEEPDAVLSAIIKVSNNGRYISQPVQALISRAQQEDKLTSRERQVIRHIAEGLTTKEISQVMGVSPKTIDNHRTNLMQKLDLHNVAEVVIYAAKSGLA